MHGAASPLLRVGAAEIPLHAAQRAFRVPGPLRTGTRRPHRPQHRRLPARHVPCSLSGWRRPAAGGTGQQSTIAVGPPPLPPPPGGGAADSPRLTFLGSGWSALLLVCTTVMAICAAVSAVVLSLRPILAAVARAAAANERAAVEMETAAKEWENAALKFQAELDLTMPEVAAASREFGALGRSVNTLGGLTTGGISRPMGVVQQTTSNSLRKVVSDVSQLTNALTPTMDEWRRRMSWMTGRFNAVKAGGGPPPALPGPQGARAWIDSWRQRTAAAESQQPTPLLSPAAAAAAAPPGGDGEPPEAMATLPMDMADLISRVREKAATRSLDAGSGLEADGDSDAAFLAARSEARAINAAAEAAEHMADQATQMAADITSASPPPPAAPSTPAAGVAPGAVGATARRQQQQQRQKQLQNQQPAGGDAAASALSASSAPPAQVGEGAAPQAQPRGRPPGLQSLSDEDVVLLGRLKDRRSAAEDVYRALRRAEAAANSAAQASGVLEDVLAAAEQSGGSRREGPASGYGSGDDSGGEDSNRIGWLPLDGMAASVAKGD